MPVPSSKLRLGLADGWPRQVLLFLVAYLVYGASRWVMTGDEASALGRTLDRRTQDASGVAVKASVKQALEGTAGCRLLNHAYLAAQVGVVPAALIWLYGAIGSPIAACATPCSPPGCSRCRCLAVPGRAAPAGRARDRRHDHPADRPGARLQAAAASTTPSPPSRPCTAALRSRSRRAGNQRPAALDAASSSRGRRRSSSPSSPPATTSCSTSSPASPPPGWASAWRGSWPALAEPAKAPGTADRRAARARSRRSSPWLTFDASPAELGRVLDELPVDFKASRASSAELPARNTTQARSARRERLEHYVDAMTLPSGCASPARFTCSPPASTKISHSPTSGGVNGTAAPSSPRPTSRTSSAWLPMAPRRPLPEGLAPQSAGLPGSAIPCCVAGARRDNGAPSPASDADRRIEDCWDGDGISSQSHNGQSPPAYQCSRTRRRQRVGTLALASSRRSGSARLAN